MKNILKRFALIISLILGIQITYLFLSPYDSFFTFIIVSWFFTFFIKQTLLRDSYIENELSDLQETQDTVQKIDAAKSVSPDLDDVKISFKKELTPVLNEVIKEETSPTTLHFSIPPWIVSFFQENLLAKIGGILLFLWVLFFLSLIYKYLDPIGKLSLGFMMGWLFFISGMIWEKRWYIKEGLTLLWVGILVNYLVILSGRYIIHDSQGVMILTSTPTFILLIINSLISIVTSLYYRSENLLLFSFAIAYLNPLLIGSPKIDTPYGLLGYNAILTSASYLLSLMYSNKNEKNLVRYLLYTWCIWGNILAILAPLNIHESFGFLIKIFATVIISLFPIFMSRETLSKKEILSYSVWGYIFLFFNIFWLPSSGEYFNEVFSYIWFLSTLFIFLFAIVFKGILVQDNQTSELPLTMFIPFIFLLYMFYTHETVLFFIPSFLIIFATYLIIFSLLKKAIGKQIQLYMFTLLWIVLMLFNGAFLLRGEIFNNLLDYSSIFITIAIFYLFCIYQSFKKDLSAAWVLWTFGTIIMTFPLLKTTGIEWYIWIVSLGVFLFTNLISIISNKNLTLWKIEPLALALLAQWGFLLYEIHRYVFDYFKPDVHSKLLPDGSILSLSQDVFLGSLYIILWVVYLFFSFLYFKKNSLKLDTQEPDMFQTNVFYTLAALWFSSIPLWITTIYGSSSGISISFIFVEIALLISLYSLASSKKIFLFAYALSIFSIIPILDFYSTIETGNYLLLWNIGLIFLTFISNIYFHAQAKKWEELDASFHILQYFLLWAMYLLTIKVLPSWFEYQNGVLSIVALVFALTFWKFWTKCTKASFPYFFLWLLCIHIINLWYEIESPLKESTNYLYTFLFCLWAYGYTYFSKEKNGLIFWGTIIYTIYTTTFYLQDYFDNNFAITIYWGILFVSLLAIWISYNFQKVRTFWLYILLLLLWKIIGYDIWTQLDGSLARVVALMFVGWIMIYVSMLYSKRGNLSIQKDLSLENFFWKWENSASSTTSNLWGSFQKESQKQVNILIKNIDVSDIKSIVLYPNGGEKTQIKWVNFYKIVKLVTQQTWKTIFLPWELTHTYNSLLENYETQIPKTTFVQVTNVLKNFVLKWGNVEIVMK